MTPGRQNTTPSGQSPPPFGPSHDIAGRLRRFVDLEEVGPDGFWLWLDSVLPLLPDPKGRPPAAERKDRLRALARDLTDCASDRARLHALAARYYADNVTLARRVKALEAMRETTRKAGMRTTDSSDPEAAEAAARYLPK